MGRYSRELFVEVVFQHYIVFMSSHDKVGRSYQGLTVEELAEIVGCSTSTVRRYVNEEYLDDFSRLDEFELPCYGSKPPRRYRPSMKSSTTHEVRAERISEGKKV